MKNKTHKNGRRPFQDGQVWQMVDSNLEIGLVGKTLVHYKHYKGQLKRAPISLASIQELGKFLQANKAVLIQP